MSVGSKLALLVLILPIILILIAFTVVIYYFGSSFDAKAILETLSTLISLVLVDLLVWERLRESVSKKLEYLHKYILSKIQFSFGKRYSLFEIKNLLTGIEENSAHLERYGRFLRILLYPKGLPKKVEEFMSLYGEFWSVLQKLTEGTGINPEYVTQIETLCYHLGYEGAGEYEAPEFVSNMAKKLLKEQLELVKKGKVLFGELKRMKKQIPEEIETFLRSNNLPFEPKPIVSFAGYR